MLGKIPGEDVNRLEKSILIIEEDAGLREVLVAGLALFGPFRVHAVPDEEHTGWMRFLRQQPDCIIMEEYSAERNDFQFARNVRATTPSPHTMLVLLTDHDPDQVSTDQMFDLILKKPFQLAQLAQTIADHLESVH